MIDFKNGKLICDTSLPKKYSWIFKPYQDNVFRLQEITGESLSPSVQEFLHNGLKIQAQTDWNINSTLRPYQKEAVCWLIQRSRALLGIEPGLGKSAIAIETWKHTGFPNRVLVVSPLSLLWKWKTEWKKWGGIEATPVLREELRSRPGIFLTNYENLGKVSGEWDLIIFDESSLLKNRKAKRSQAAFSLSRLTKRVWMLSGTPITRFADDLYMQFRILQPDRFTSYWRFAEETCFIEQDYWGYKNKGSKPNIEDRLKLFYSDIYYPLSRKDLGQVLVYTPMQIEIPLSLKLEKAYSELEQDFYTVLEKERIVATSVASKVAQLRHLLAQESGLVQFVQDAEKYSPGPILVWFYHKVLGEKLAKYYPVLSGDTGPKERQELVQKFQAGKLPILAVQLGTAKYGLDLDQARTVIYVELTYEGEAWVQSQYRVFRGGEESIPTFYILLPVRTDKKTVAHAIYDNLRKKEYGIKRLVERLKEK